MKITRITYKDYHDPVYGVLDRHPDIRAKLDNPPDFIKQMIGYDRRNAYMGKLGLRVAAVSSRYLEAVSAYGDSAVLGEYLEEYGMENVLSRMKSCYPGGAEADLTSRYYCDKYAVCPWCRFRKAVEIGGKLGGRLRGSGGIAVIRISHPEVCEFMFDDPSGAYATLVRSVCKRSGLFECDAVVTVPNWYQDYMHNSSYYDKPKEWVFSKDTSIIGILPKTGGDLPLPEELVPVQARKKMGYCGAPAWRVYPPTAKNLRCAIGYAIRFSPGLLSKKISPERYIECIDMQSRYRAVYHGFKRGA